MLDRYGMSSRDPYVELSDVPSLMEAQVAPLRSIYAPCHDLFPTNYYVCAFDFKKGAEGNFEIASEYFTEILGRPAEPPAPQFPIHRWHYNEGKITLRSGPDGQCELAIEIYIDQFFHVPPTNQQKKWLSEIVPFALASNMRPVINGYCKLVRLADEGFFPAMVGKSADLQALVGRENEKGWFIPKQSISRIVHHNIRTGKEGNSPELLISVEYENPYSSCGKTASMDIFSHKI